MPTSSCPTCNGKKYVIVTRENDGLKVIQACDGCEYGVLSDQEAAYMAKQDGIDCERVYPFALNDQA